MKKWFKKAYSFGRVPSASFHLDILYYDGSGIERNCSIALRLLKEYIKNKISSDKNNLLYRLTCRIYRYGNNGAPQDYQKARECLLKTYELGQYEAAIYLAKMHSGDQGVE